LALSGTTRIVLSEAETEAMLKDILQSHPNDDEVVLALGPEGGWTDDELELFQEAGWISASLGNTILRAETAAVASLAVVLAELRA
jgi:16S rRNA (uracil1498-N3)-methyltransferase